MGAEIERIQETLADVHRGLDEDLRRVGVWKTYNEAQRRGRCRWVIARVQSNQESFAKFSELVNDSATSPQQVARPAAFYVKKYTSKSTSEAVFGCTEEQTRKASHLHVLAEHIPRGKIASKL